MYIYVSSLHKYMACYILQFLVLFPPPFVLHVHLLGCCDSYLVNTEHAHRSLFIFPPIDAYLNCYQCHI